MLLTVQTSPQRRWASLPFLMALALTACDRGAASSSGDLIDSETFIATYVDLRSTALGSGVALIGAEDRSSVLARHGVSEEELTRFVEEHGADVEFMRDIWDEVERRLDGQRPDAGGGEPGNPS